MDDAFSAGLHRCFREELCADLQQVACLDVCPLILFLVLRRSSGSLYLDDGRDERR
jgi:hypothetical protein